MKKEVNNLHPAKKVHILNTEMSHYWDMLAFKSKTEPLQKA